MISSKYSSIVEMLAESGVRYPVMRFGQLISMLCGLADTNDCLEIEQVTNQSLLAIELNRSALNSRLDLEGRDDLYDVAIREEILQEFERLFDRTCGDAVGKLTSIVATRANSNIYDIEDQAFLSTIKSLNAELEANAKSTNRATLPGSLSLAKN